MSRASRLSNILTNMKQRCYNPKNNNYKFYGERGVTICDEWLNTERTKGNCSKGYVAFRDWALSHGYTDKLTIDRIDNDKGYSSDNCRWVSMKVQSNNLRKNIFLTYKGKTQTIHQWCEELNLNYERIRERICRKGWSVEEAFETKEKKSCRYLTYNGKTQTINEWGIELGIKPNTISSRLKYGWTVERALSEI